MFDLVSHYCSSNQAHVWFDEQLCSSNRTYVWFGEPLLLIKSSICLIWWATMLIKSNTKLLDVGKQLNLVIFEYFFGQFLPKTFTLYIKNTYFAKKLTQIPFHGLRKGSNNLDRAREGCHRLLSWQIQRSKWAKQVGWVGQLTSCSGNLSKTT